MARIGVFIHNYFLRHEAAGGWHPESPDRLLDARAGLDGPA
jgi:hypothetical protein